MPKDNEPTVEDYQRFIDSVMIFLTTRTTELDKRSETKSADALREVQKYVTYGRSKRGL